MPQWKSNVASTWLHNQVEKPQQPRDEAGRFVSRDESENLIETYLQHRGLSAAKIQKVVAPIPTDETEEDIVQAHLISHTEALKKFMNKPKTNIQNFYICSSPGSLSRR